LPELPVWSRKISIKNLLQYSSGLPKVEWNEFFNQGINVTDQDILHQIKDVNRLEFEPGTNYLYSNCNPILLIKIVEKITQSDFKAYLEQNIFTPLEMEGTTIKNQYPYKDKSLMAIPFNVEFVEDAYKVSSASLLFSSTARDLQKWFETLDDFKVVNKESLKLLSQEAIVGDNIQSPIGRGVWKNDRLVEHSHHGSTASYECIARRFKHDAITIVILTNQKHRNVFEISDMIYKIVAESN
jgi:CubicO group peptidase (beta-lactamase class C family)